MKVVGKVLIGVLSVGALIGTGFAVWTVNYGNQAPATSVVAPVVVQESSQNFGKLVVETIDGEIKLDAPKYDANSEGIQFNSGEEDLEVGFTLKAIAESVAQHPYDIGKINRGEFIDQKIAPEYIPDVTIKTNVLVADENGQLEHNNKKYSVLGENSVIYNELTQYIRLPEQVDSESVEIPYEAWLSKEYEQNGYPVNLSFGWGAKTANINPQLYFTSTAYNTAETSEERAANFVNYLSGLSSLFNDNDIKFQFVFTVKGVERFEGEVDTTLKGLEFTQSELNLKVGGQAQVGYKFIPSYAANKELSWVSKNTKVAVVNNLGLVTAIGEGSTVIEAISKENNEIKASLTVNVEAEAQPEVVLTGITLTSAPTKLEYEIGEELDLAGLVITANYSDQSQQTLEPAGYTVDDSAFDSTKAGTYEIKVSVETYEASFNVTVNEEELPPLADNQRLFDFTAQGYENAAEVAGLEVSPVAIAFGQGTNAKNAPKYYTTGNAVRMYSGNEMTISSSKYITKVELVFGEGESNNAILANVGELNDNVWTGEAGEIKLSIDGTSGHRRIQKVIVTISDEDVPSTPEVTLEYIALDLEAVKDEYEVGEALDLTGLVVTAHYSDQSQQVLLDTEYEVDSSAFDGTKAGKYDIFVNYQGKQAQFSVEVNEAQVEPPVLENAEQFVFENFGYENATDVTTVNGDVVTLAFDQATGNNAPKYYTGGAAVRMYAGNTLTISSETKNIVKVEFTVVYKDEDPYMSLEADKGELTEMVWEGDAGTVTFTCGSAQTRIISMIVHYGEKGEEPEPQVTLTGISINADSLKKEYAIGEELDLTGLVVTGHYSDESEQEITSGYSVDDKLFDNQSAGEYTITISYGEFSASYEVTVSAGEEPQEPQEPAHVSATIEELYNNTNGAYDDGKVKKQIYEIEGYVVGYNGSATSFGQYGNFMIADSLEEGAASLLVYGATETASALTWDSESGEYKFTNPKDFATGELTSTIILESKVKMYVSTLIYGETKELNGIVTSVDNSHLDIQNTPEPATIAKTVSELLETEASTTQAYTVTAKISRWKGNSADKYGNLYLVDPEDESKEIYVYGSTATAGALVWNEANAAYSYTNQQDFLTNEVTKDIAIGDTVSMKVIRVDYKGQVQLNAVITDVQHAQQDPDPEPDPEPDPDPVDPQQEDGIKFNLGADGEASHKDGSEISEYSEANGDYTLTLSSLTKVYGGAVDAAGNGCLKLGTGKAAGSFTISSIPSEVSKVVIGVAGYKTNAAKITVNGSEEVYTTSKNSNDGEYDALEVVPVEGEITFTTATGGLRCMINYITFIVE